MQRKRFTRTWKKNTDTEIFPENEEEDLNIYRDMAHFDLDFAIKKLLYDSDMRLTSKEISRIVGLQEGYLRYILRHMLYRKDIKCELKGRTMFYYVEKVRRVINTRKEVFDIRSINRSS
jgi:hypothetical protein